MNDPRILFFYARMQLFMCSQATHKQALNPKTQRQSGRDICHLPKRYIAESSFWRCSFRRKYRNVAKILLTLTLEM